MRKLGGRRALRALLRNDSEKRRRTFGASERTRDYQSDAARRQIRRAKRELRARGDECRLFVESA